MASIASIVTTGGMWPVDKSSCEKGSVIFLSAEDDPSDTIVPRLKAARADLSKIAIIDSVTTGYDSEGNPIPKHFNLATDLMYLNDLLRKLSDVALIIIDPITAYLGDIDSHRTSDVRALLAPLSRLAEKHDVAVVCISHLNKGGSREALMRVTGSLGFVAAARAAYVVVKDQNNPSKQLLLPVKNNLGNDQTGLAFSIESQMIEDNIESSCVAWSPEVITITADQAMSSQEEPEERSALEEAEEFLHDLLANGQVSAKKIKKAADDAGHSWATIRRAKSRLGINTKKSGSEWFWELPSKSLPKEDAQGAHDAQTKSLSILSNLNEFDPNTGKETLKSLKDTCETCGYLPPFCLCIKNKENYYG